MRRQDQWNGGGRPMMGLTMLVLSEENSERGAQGRVKDLANSQLLYILRSLEVRPVVLKHKWRGNIDTSWHTPKLGCVESRPC
jgi:hypothetical protein